MAVWQQPRGGYGWQYNTEASEEDAVEGIQGDTTGTGLGQHF